MLLTLTVITALLHAALTAGVVTVWRTVKRTSPELMAKAFFAVTAARMAVSILFFAVAVFLVYDDMETVKAFTAIFLAAYMLLLVFDTVYFCRSSREPNKGNRQ